MPQSKQKIERKSALVNEALKNPIADRKRLRDLATVKDPLSHSQLAERLGYKSKGAVDGYLKRMKKRGLLIIRKKSGAKKNEGAMIIELTPKAKEMLQALDEHLTSQ